MCQVTSKLPSSFLCAEHLPCMGHPADAGDMPAHTRVWWSLCKAWKERQILEGTLLRGS